MITMERMKGAVAIDIREPVVSPAQEHLNDIGNEPMTADNFTIFRVPAHVRQRNKQLYEPRMVAIGPYGPRDEPSLQAREQIKWRYLQEFLSRSGNTTNEDIKVKLQEVVPRARRCYFELVELSTEKFVEMLLLDGCFIIEFLIKWNGGDRDGLFAAAWSSPLVRGDLLLLENQIPLFVLEKLFEHVTLTINGSLMELLEKYLTAMKVESPEESPREAKDCLHLLYLYCHCYVTKPQTDSEGGGNSEEGTQANRSPRSNVPRKAKDFHHLLHLYYDCYVTKPQTADSKGGGNKRRPRTIPSATELLNAGVTIKKKDQKKNQNQNRLSSFLDVTFSSGVLEMSFLSVENSTLSRFSNLVAFEQCGGRKLEEAYMTSYAVFMDCLIDTPEDAAVLHQRGILENKLASDKELAVFFNHLSDWATLDYDNHYLAGLFGGVGEYCEHNWPKWRAKLVRDYFSNPWSIISLIAATFLLILTTLQTVFSI